MVVGAAAPPPGQGRQRNDVGGAQHLLRWCCISAAAAPQSRGAGLQGWSLL